MKLTREQRRERRMERYQRRQTRHRVRNDIRAMERVEVRALPPREEWRMRELCNRQQQRGLQPAEVSELLDLLEMAR